MYVWELGLFTEGIAGDYLWEYAILQVLQILHVY